MQRFPGEGASDDSGVVDNGNFQSFRNSPAETLVSGDIRFMWLFAEVLQKEGIKRQLILRLIFVVTRKFLSDVTHQMSASSNIYSLCAVILVMTLW